MGQERGRAVLFGIGVFLCASIYPGCAQDISEPAPGKAFPGRYVDVQGKRIRVVQAGSGPDVLLIHGLPGVIEDWEAILPELSRKYRVTAYDRPGHGFSTANDLQDGVEQNVEVALALVDQLKLDKPVVVGHSYGGSIVVAMAERNPPNIRSFVAVSPVTSGVGQPDTIFYLVDTPILGTLSTKLVKLLSGCKMIEEGVTMAFHPNEKDIPSDYVETRCAIWFQPRVARTLAREEIAIRPDVRKIAAGYGDIKGPLFIVQGEKDQDVPVSDARLLNEAVPGSRLILLRDTGHMVQYAKPAELIRTIDEAARY